MLNVIECFGRARISLYVLENDASYSICSSITHIHNLMTHTSTGNAELHNSQLTNNIYQHHKISVFHFLCPSLSLYFLHSLRLLSCLLLFLLFTIHAYFGVCVWNSAQNTFIPQSRSSKSMGGCGCVRAFAFMLFLCAVPVALHSMHIV